MQKMTLLLALVLCASTSFARIWRVNNNAGVVADFSDINTAISSASVLAGDTIHVEPSATTYSGITTVNKRLIFIGAGYFLDPADATFPANTGLQVATKASSINSMQIASLAAAGSKFMGLRFASTVTLYGMTPASTPSPVNLTFERVFFGGGITFSSNGANNHVDGITIRKCYFDAILINSSATASNLTVENCIFWTAYCQLSLTGSNNVVRNNSFYVTGTGSSIVNAYVANNIFSFNGQNSFTNCTIKNNLFAAAQTLPGTATGNQVSINMANVFVGGTTGPRDPRVQLKAGSPAIGAGVTISGYTPDAGAFGATDPYKLSGIPAVPSIYSLTVPASIPTGTATMNVTFSSRNNN